VFVRQEEKKRVPKQAPQDPKLKELQQKLEARKTGIRYFIYLRYFYTSILLHLEYLFFVIQMKSYIVTITIIIVITILIIITITILIAIIIIIATNVYHASIRYYRFRIIVCIRQQYYHQPS